LWGRLRDFVCLLHRRHCWACSSSSVALGSPKEAATTLTIDGTSHVQGYDWTVASAACRAAHGRASEHAHPAELSEVQGWAQSRRGPTVVTCIGSMGAVTPCM